VIHTVGPNHAAGERDRSLLVSCYARSLAIADELGVTSIAFPLISAGIYAWPLQDAVDAAVSTLLTATTHVEQARIVAFSDRDHAAVLQRLG
jgi:O-acetyl-ADP-ribose deacetylase (regulator of RNase III)